MNLLLLIAIFVPLVLGQNNICTTENSCATNPKRDCSCFEYMLATHPFGFHANVQPDPSEPEFEVQCSKLDGKLWTVIQERLNSNEAELAPDGFDRNYNEYEDGFGNITGNYWMGLKKIHALTTAVDMSMRLEMHRENDNVTLVYGQYDVFRVSGPSTKYRLVIAGYTGTAAMTIESDSNGRPFSAKDQDNGGEDCPARWKGGWWYAQNEISCATCTPNGPYNTDKLGQLACDTGGFGREKAVSMQIHITPEDYLKN
ncbi:fibrinogen C domain-containing protein 1-like [Littorina saxatilis]|uniref:Fibrinogen C-terminal domain-containing protein n=1 Tax=Littorina saxatilis TaxID=31220 RepID=A0AAN9G121_9CAEN